MPIFRDLNGEFYSLSDDLLRQSKIKPEALPSELADNQVTGTEIGGPDSIDVGSESGLRHSRITINQFFAPVGSIPSNENLCKEDFIAQYNYPAAWGCKR